MRRRVPGLRREEVVMLAAWATTTTCVWKGWENSPSPQVIDAIAAALHFDDETHDHLRRLTRAPQECRSVRAEHERTTPQPLRLITSWPDTPAFILARPCPFWRTTRSPRHCTVEFSGSTTWPVLANPAGEAPRTPPSRR